MKYLNNFDLYKFNFSLTRVGNSVVVVVLGVVFCIFALLAGCTVPTAQFTHRTMEPRYQLMETANRFEPKTISHALQVRAFVADPSELRYDDSQSGTLPDSAGIPSVIVDRIDIRNYKGTRDVLYQPMYAVSYGGNFHLLKNLTLGAVAIVGYDPHLPATHRSVLSPFSIMGGPSVAFGGALRNNPCWSMAIRTTFLVGRVTKYQRSFDYYAGNSYNGNPETYSVKDTVESELSLSAEQSFAVQYRPVENLGLYVGGAHCPVDPYSHLYHGGFSWYHTLFILTATGGAMLVYGERVVPYSAVTFTINYKVKKYRDKKDTL